MALIQRANVVLEISDDIDEINYYKCKGFNVVDKNGNVIDEAQPIDLDSFKAAYFKAMSKVKVLEEENEKLKAEIKALNEQQKSTKKKTKEE